MKEVAKIKKEGVTEAELHRAKDQLKGSTVLGMESSSHRMSWAAKSEFYYGRILTLEEVFAKIDRVTRDDLIALAQKTFVDDYLTLTVIGDLATDQLPMKEMLELSFDHD